MELELSQIFDVVRLVGLMDEFNQECFDVEEDDKLLSKVKTQAFFEKHDLPMTTKDFEDRKVVNFHNPLKNNLSYSKGDVIVVSPDRVLDSHDFINKGSELLIVEFLEDIQFGNITLTTDVQGSLESALQPYANNNMIAITKVNSSVVFIPTLKLKEDNDDNSNRTS